MGLAKKMDWLKWIRKYSTGILDTKTGSMETLIDSASSNCSKTINYAYTSSVIADDEFINAAAPPHQRPMLPPPPPTSQDSASPSPPQLPNDVYDCCVSLDGIPIKHEFQYTFSDTDGHGKITKHDVEGLATKILESMYGTTLKFSSRGQRTVKVTLNIRQSVAVVVDGTKTSTPYRGHQSSRERKTRSDRHRGKTDATEYGVVEDSTLLEQPDYLSVYDGIKGSWAPHHRSTKLGAQRYRREQLIEMVQRSLAENLSFQNQRKSEKPTEVVYHRPRTKRRQTGAPPAKVAWSPYDFEPVAYVPSHQHHHHNQQHHHRQHEHLKNVRSQQQQLYSNYATAEEHGVKYSSGRSRQHHRATAVVSGSKLQQSKDAAAATTATTATAAAQEQSKNMDHQRYKRAKLASKKIHHHIHEHHHYHHYDYYIV